MRWEGFEYYSEEEEDSVKALVRLVEKIHNVAAITACFRFYMT
jgi:hypothetical protein